MAPRVWFITGASAGFGRLMTELVLAKGEIAVATLRKPDDLSDLTEKYDSTKLLVLKLDVTVKADIVAAFARVKEAFGRIDVVFNNAAIATFGEIEALSDEAVRGMFETNFWGAAEVSKAAVQFFREVNRPIGGRLLQISSMAGIEGNPNFGFYSASKFALEGLSEALSKELDPKWNIKVAIIEPGGFRTRGFIGVKVIPAHPAYTDPSLPSNLVRKLLEGALDNGGGDPAKGIEIMYRFSSIPEPPLRFALGKDSIASSRRKIQSLTSDVDQYEAWSEDLQIVKN